MLEEIFNSLATLFNKNGYRLYIVGGTSRDYLLKRDISDFDFATDATPYQMKLFLDNGIYTFAKYGTVKLKINNIHVDITTFRKEENYSDYRHPGKIIFTKNIEEDYLRRDFTINALYIDENYKIFDFCSGIDDLNNKVIRFIGEPSKRIKEDPLRILRAKRFAKKLGFTLSSDTKKAIDDNIDLIDKLNPQKVKEELKKFEK